MRSGRAIARNTLVLYARQLLILFVSLYTVRVVLNVLGVEDFGIYSVVAGVVALCTFLPGTMASATQRFFSFAIGKNDEVKLRQTFSVNCVLYVGIAVISLLILESVGLWFVNSELHVPPGRLEAARSLYRWSSWTFVISIFTAPFIAIIIAHEDMQLYAYASIVEALMKLAVVFFLVDIPWDKLELYGILLFFVGVITAVIYVVICLRKYKECQFRTIHWNAVLLREIIGFTGWTLFGQLTTVARNQAVTILLNQMFSPIVVASRAISMSIASQVNIFSSNFNTGLYPPIIKSYAEGNKQEMFSLVFNGSKLTFFLMWIFALPMFLIMDPLLQMWLKNPPEEAALFTRLALIESLIMSLSLPIATAARASGQMKIYELTLGSIQMGILASSWVVLKIGGEAYAVYVVAIVANVLMFIVRLQIVQGMIGLSFSAFSRQVLLPVVGVIVFSCIPAIAAYVYLPKGVLFALLTVLVCLISTSISMYYVGLSDDWRNKIRQLVFKKLQGIGILK